MSGDAELVVERPSSPAPVVAARRPAALFSPEVIWAAARLPEPERVGEQAWTIGSRSEPTKLRWVHTDAQAEANALTFATCNCPAGMKGELANGGRIAGCGHVFRVLMLIASGKAPPAPDPVLAAVADVLERELDRAIEGDAAEVLTEEFIDRLASLVLAEARRATRESRKEAAQ